MKEEKIDVKKINIKYPFSGVAPNLIDKFLVLGYEQKTIDYTILRNEEEPNKKYQTNFKFFLFEERPSIINEISNNYSKDLLDEDLVLEVIFPNYPYIYFIEKQNVNNKSMDDELLINTYSIIFSINPQDNSGSKRSYNGLGYIFYVSQEYKYNNEIDGFLYVPMGYVILSEYPYFYHYNEICKNIYSQMKKENEEIPIDIILYNLIKYCPSPINKSINLSFGAQLSVNQNTRMTINKILSPLNEIKFKKVEKGIPLIFFNQLSGYPFLDLNLSFLFNLLPADIIVEVFIFSFLEHDIIFYSENPEILNLVMYIFSNFNYPFNDNIYYWHILSVSQDSFMKGTSTFVGKTCSTLTGILNEYDENIKTTNKIREHFVLDIDNKNFFFLYVDNTEEVEETFILYNYIKSCIAKIEENEEEINDIDKKEKKKLYYFNDGIHLYDAIKNLMEELLRRARKVTSINYNEKKEKPSFFNIYEDESEAECMKVNMRLQKAFFSFIMQITQNFLSGLDVGEKSEDNNKQRDKRYATITVNLKKENPKNEDNEEENEEYKEKKKLAKKAGEIFNNKFKECSKYSSFVINFCQYHDTIDLYKIPYTFMNEIIYYSNAAIRNNMNEVDIFKLIDQFYGKKRMINFENFFKKKDNIDNEKDIENELVNVFSFSFDKFVEFYKKELRDYINREQEDDRDIFIKIKGTSRNYKKYKRNGFNLSNIILNDYILFLNNNYKEIKKVFKLEKCEYEKENQSLLKKYIPKNDLLNDFVIFEKKNEHEFMITKLASLSQKNDNKINEKDDNDGKENKINENEEEYIDYYSLQSKNKTERNLKFFGSFEFMEISDVIERHFIFERCFSSYAIIKFSLLNILAITRTFENMKIRNKNVMKIICDFCAITKSPVRKYMNIYLNVFQNIKKKILIILQFKRKVMIA